MQILPVAGIEDGSGSSYMLDLAPRAEFDEDNRSLEESQQRCMHFPLWNDQALVGLILAVSLMRTNASWKKANKGALKPFRTDHAHARFSSRAELEEDNRRLEEC